MKINKCIFQKLVAMTVSAALVLSSTNLSVLAVDPAEGESGLASSVQQYENSTETIVLLDDLSDFTIENGVLLKYNGTGSQVTIPDSVISIAANAFSGANSITTITITDSVTSIGNRAFQGCENLITVNIGSGVSTVGEAPFMYCLKLQEIKVNSSNPSITSLEGVLFDKAMTKLLAFPNGKGGSYSIPEGIKTLANRAFCWSTEITSLTIPDSITSLEYYSIALCTKLTSVEFNGACAGLTAMGNVFYGTNNLEILTIPKNVSDIDVGQFASNTKLSHIKLHIENQNFSVENEILFNKEKSKLILSNKVITGEYQVPITTAEILPAAFSNCIGLTDIYIPSQTIKIGDVNAYYSVFKNCTNLTIHGEEGSAAQQYAIANNIPFVSANGTVIVPVTGIKIEQAAAEGTIGQTIQLKAVISPENATNKAVTWESSNTSVAVIDSNGLISCAGAGEAIITVKTANNQFSASCTIKVHEVAPVPNEDFVIVDGILTQYKGAGGDVTIPDGIKGIGEMAFDSCSSLISVTMPDSVISIGDNAFVACVNLLNVNLPESLTSIGAKAFQSCHSLKSITVPNSVISIGAWAFYACVSLTSVSIPDSVTSIGERLFNACYSLTTVDVSSNNTAYSSIDGILYNKSKTTLIYYPVGKTDSLFTVPNSVTNIGSYAFEECSKLTKVTISNSVTSIGDGAFDFCTNLREVNLPSSVTSIGRDAFSSCRALINVTIPDNVTSIEQRTFYNCSSLTAVTIPDGVTYISGSAFDYCPKLTLYGTASSYAAAFAKENGNSFTSTSGEYNPFSYGYIPPKTTISEESVHEITDISHEDPKPFIKNTVTAPSAEVTNRSGDLEVVNSDCEIKSGDLSCSGNIIVEQGTLKIPVGSTVSCRNIKLRTNGRLIVEGKVYTDSLEMYGGSSSDVLGGQLIVKGNSQYLTRGALECRYLDIKDYAKLTLSSKANLIVNENITIQNKLKNELTSGNIWVGGDFAQKNGGWFNQGADNFQAGSNLSVILFVGRVLNGDMEHKLEFQSNTQSWLSNLYIVDTLWNEFENKTRSFYKKNLTIKGKSALVHKHDNLWSFTLITYNNTKLEIESTIRSTIEEMKRNVAIIDWGIPEFGDRNTEANKAVALVAAALASNLHYTKTSAFGIYGVYNEADIKIKYKKATMDLKLQCKGVEVAAGTFAEIKYSLDKGKNYYNYGTMFKLDTDRVYDDLYNYAKDQYKEALASMIQLPLPDLLTWKEIDSEKVLTEYFFKSLYNNIGGTMVEFSFPKQMARNNNFSSLQGFSRTTFNASLFSQVSNPLTVSSSQVMEDNLKEAICEALKVQSFEAITKETIEATTRLDLSNKYITSLAGMEQFVNLETLFMSGNAVSDLSPISGLTKLRELDFSGNNVSSLAPLQGLTNITSLKMADNYCGEISPLASLLRLEILDISNNNVYALEPISVLTGLKTLYISGNALNNKSLDALTALENLQTLAASSCNIENMAALANKPLLFVDLSNNEIADISKLSGEILQTVNLSGNVISDISTLGQIPNLINLDLTGNKVSIIEGIASLSKLKSLYLSDNPLVDITVIGGLTQIEKLDCGNIQGNDFGPIALLSSLKELSISNTRLADLSFLIGKDSLQKLTLSNCYLDDNSTKILSALTNLQDIDFSFNYISDLSPFSSLLKLRNLNLDNNNLEDSPSNQTVLASIASRGGSISIKAKAIVLYDILLSEKTTLNIGQTEQLIPLLMPLNASNQKVSWTSDNTAVAAVDENGRITAVAAGNAVVTVTTEEGGYTASCTVTVPPLVDVCDFNKDGVVDIIDLAAAARSYNTRNTDASWNSIFDLNKDDIIDIFDLVICSRRL